MVIATATLAIAAGARINLLQGNTDATVTRPYKAEFAVVAEGPGILTTIKSGSDVVMEEGATPVVAANVQPNYPDMFYLSDLIDQGETISIVVRNPTAGALNVRSVTILTPLV